MIGRKTYGPYVRRGVELLNEKGPEDWPYKLDLRKLNLTSIFNCVVGQLYGGYGRGAVELGISASQAEKMGFLHPPGVYRAGLRSEWRRQVKKERRKILAARRAAEAFERALREDTEVR